MSVKYFCDRCGVELRDRETGRLTSTMGDLSVEIMHSWKGTWNAGHVCHECIRDVIVRGKPDERDKPR